MSWHFLGNTGAVPQAPVQGLAQWVRVGAPECLDIWGDCEDSLRGIPWGWFQLILFGRSWEIGSVWLSSSPSIWGQCGKGADFQGVRVVSGVEAMA